MALETILETKITNATSVINNDINSSSNIIRNVERDVTNTRIKIEAMEQDGKSNQHLF